MTTSTRSKEPEQDSAKDEKCSHHQQGVAPASPIEEGSRKGHKEDGDAAVEHVEPILGASTCRQLGAPRQGRDEYKHDDRDPQAIEEAAT